MRKLSREVVILALLSAVVGPAINPQSRSRFDLKGDGLGESLAVFKAKHPRAPCHDVSDRVVDCRDPDASFAGRNPYIDHEKEGDCRNCGLAAEFLSERLTFISYSVSNMEGDGAPSVFDLLAAKFGKPVSHAASKPDGLETALWKNASETLSLLIATQPRPEITVTLRLTKSSSDKDI